MKKTFLTLFCIIILVFLATTSFAQEKFDINIEKNNNYLILLNDTVNEIMANDATAMNFEILTTLYNEKNQIMLTPLKEGNFRLYITLKNDEYIVLKINSNTKNIEKLETPNSKLIKTILKLDTIEEKKDTSKKNEKQKKKLEIELDEPPIFQPNLRGAH